MRRVLALLSACLVTTAMVAAPTVADAAENTRAERERVRRQRAAAATELDALRAEDAEVTAALRAMNAEVAAQESALDAAEQAVTAAEQRLADARAAEDAVATRMQELQTSLREMAIQEFISGGSAGLHAFDSDTGDIAEMARRAALAEIAAGSAEATADELGAAREDLGLAREAAVAASEAAAARRTAVADQLASVTAVRNQQAALATRVDERIEARLAESAALAGLDQRLSAQLAQEQAALAARNPGGRGSSARVVRGNVPLRTVRGITVHADIADELESMLSAAASDGLSFGGGGYRDPEQQRALRRQHCPDPENSPPRDCRPPTARPGYSMHEQGLAIDFTYGGSTVRRGSAAYRWLSANAGRFGLRNLPEESWHWSTNGR